MTIEQLYQYFLQFPKVCTDTRKDCSNAIFFALHGPTFNGNEYASKALLSGAAYVVVDDKQFVESEKYILVDDTLTTLQELAAFHRSQLNVQVLAITGSNGKTTTKELIHRVLSNRYKVQSTFGNYNNHIGVPLTLLSISQDDEIAIIELGTNNKGEIEFLCNLCRPNLGLICSIGKAHLEGLESLHGILEEKTALYRFLQQNNGTIFFPSNSRELTKALPVETVNISYSNKRGFHYSIKTIRSFPTIELEIQTADQCFILKSELYGGYNVLNISAALTVGGFFGVSMEEAIHELGKYIPKNNRSQKISYQGAEVYLDAYNANPTSTIEAIKGFASYSLPSKVLILGDMLELGISSCQEHERIIHFVDQLNCWENVIFVGLMYGQCRFKIPKNENHLFFEDSLQVSSWLEDKDIKGKAILVKGSRGLKLEQIFQVNN